jgi:hypothetical protein
MPSFLTTTDVNLNISFVLALEYHAIMMGNELSRDTAERDFPLVELPPGSHAIATISSNDPGIV